MASPEKEIIDEITSNFNIKSEIQRKRRVYVSIPKSNLIEICKWVKKKGFIHLSAISVTDLADEGHFELTYHLWSYDIKIIVIIKTKINRNKPIIESVMPIWHENAQIHEREMHELFGVQFEGNPDLSELFLDGWNGPPPFRKDFDWRDYVKKECYDEKNEREIAYYD